MKSDLQLGKIRLINWHNFVDETIVVDGSLFLIGDNGAGKTTLLDAVHCALTGDWKVELNAAARVGGRRGEGRNLQGLVLGHDVERGYKRREGAIAYAALEFRERSGNGAEARGTPISIGIGVYVASPDSRPEKWGFITPAPLDAVPLTLEVGGAGGSTGPGAETSTPAGASTTPAGGEDARPLRRPADRAELAAALSASHVLDIGRYRTRVGERLFESRARLEQVATFLHAGKAYRELVAKTSNFSGLIAELLPQPDLETFHEVRRALEAIERTRTDLDSLEGELARLRNLLFWLQEVAKERETIARDDYLTARHALEDAERAVEHLVAEEASARQRLADTEAARAMRAGALDTLETELDRLRAGGGMEIVDRHREVRRLLERQRASADQLAAQIEELANETERHRSERMETVDSLSRQLAAMSARLDELLEKIATLVPVPELEAARGLCARLGGMSQEADAAAVDIAAADGDRRRLRRELDSQAAFFRERRRSARREAAASLRDLRDNERRMRSLRERGESDPPLAGLHEAVGLLREAGIEAVPLYRMLEPHESLTAEEAGRIERALGRKLLGTLIVSGRDHPRALELVLEHAPGIPLADAAEAGGQIETVLREQTEAGGRIEAALREQAAPSVFDLIRIGPSDPTAEAYLRHHTGYLFWLATNAATDVSGEPGRTWSSAERQAASLTPEGRLHAARRRMHVPPGPAVWLGARARKRVLQEGLIALAQVARSARGRADQQRAEAQEAERAAEHLEAAARVVEGLDLIAVASIIHRRDELTRVLERLSSDLNSRRMEHADLVREADALEREQQVLAATMKERGLEMLAARVKELEDERDISRKELDALGEELGRCRERQAGLEQRLTENRRHAGGRVEALEAARAALANHAPEPYRADLDDYVMRIRRGRQIKIENLPAHREEAVRRVAALQERITQGEGIRHPELWQKYAFRYDGAANTLCDNTGKSIDAINEELQAQVDELNEVLRGRNEELLERIVLQELVGALRREVDHLHSTVLGVNQLMGDLVFGRTRYRIEQRLKPEMRRLNKLLRESSGLSAGSRVELRDYFATRLDEFSDPSGEHLPAVLDYRQWFEFHLRMSTLDDDGVELSRERLRQGSGGEQAVPAYLLLFCLTKLLYDGIGARARLLILDEAFYGIDAGRRNELLRFCGRAKIELVVATPEVDGVTEALPASTTVLIEKTPEADIFLFDLRYRQKTPTLFEPGEPESEEYVLGVHDPESDGLH